jgi:hypothetical protein
MDDRRFVAWQEKEGSAIQRLRHPHFHGDDIAWGELQKHQRVVILAEAGSGKTEELRTQARTLGAEGSFSFYTTVQNAATQGMAESFPNAERGQLAAWLASDKPAWFFIDSVDEAKLNRIQLSTALQRIADGIASGLRRAYVVLSGRITDWEFRVDLERFTELLPVPGDPEKLGPPSSEAILGRALRGDYRNKGYATVESADPPLVVLGHAGTRGPRLDGVRRRRDHRRVRQSNTYRRKVASRASALGGAGPARTPIPFGE